MKKLLFIALAVLPSFIYSQTFKGGFMGGLNASQVDGDTYAGYNKFGFALGAYTYLVLSESFDIQLELKYDGKGARSKPTNVGTEYTNQLNYINLPLVFRFKSNSDIGLEFGTGIGYLFSEKITNILGQSFSDNNFNTLDWSGLAGINYPVLDNLFLNFRVSYSILTIRENLNNQVYFKRGGVYNNVLTIALYYDFGNK